MGFYKLGLTKKARKLKNNVKIAQNILEEIVDKQLAKIKTGELTSKNILTTLYENKMLNETNEKDN